MNLSFSELQTCDFGDSFIPSTAFPNQIFDLKELSDFRPGTWTCLKKCSGI